MKSANAQPLNQIIDAMLKEQNLDERLFEQKILDNWPRVVGAAINRMTIRRFIIDRKLTVELSSGPLRNELMMHRSQLARALNDSVGREVITEVIIR